MNANDVEATLQAWGNRIFNSGPVKQRLCKGMTGLRLLVLQFTVPGAVAGRMEASAVRRTGGSLVQRLPQVIVRISGGGKGIRHIKAHFDYVSRNGQLPLEDQNGDKLHGN